MKARVVEILENLDFSKVDGVLADCIDHNEAGMETFIFRVCLDGTVLGFRYQETFEGEKFYLTSLNGLPLKDFIYPGWKYGMPLPLGIFKNIMTATDASPKLFDFEGEWGKGHVLQALQSLAVQKS